MIMSQERAFLKAQEQLNTLKGYVEGAAGAGRRIDEVERELFGRLLDLGRTLLEAFVAAQGDGDGGRTLEAADGRRLRRMPEPHERRYLSIFGELSIRRRVYAEREKRPVERAPLDERLGLPAGEFSYVLEDWLQRLCIKESFHEAVADLRAWLGVAPSEGAAERMNQELSKQVERFGILDEPPPKEQEGEILVATADGKGVPMRRPLEERVRRGPRRTKGEKANKKQMAYVGAVYTIDRFRRTADDVVDEWARRERAAQRPRPQQKQVWAEMTHDLEGETSPGRARLFGEMALACHQRDPCRTQTLVCLMDGEAALWEAQEKWLGRAVCILDLFHVLERLWQAAHTIHRDGSPQAAQFVEHHLRMLLEGKVGYVIGGLKRLRTEHDLKGQKRRTLNAVIRYYENNRDHMQYDEYLAAGYPIGSGVAEGACRHVVKDRMEQTGMRWTVNGAQAMLSLRTTYLNGRWNDYINFYVEAEQATLYGNLAA